MTDIPRCTSWLGHKFEARYSTTPISMNHVSIDSNWLKRTSLLEKMFTRRFYHGDICVRCGYRIDRRRE